VRLYRTQIEAVTLEAGKLKTTASARDLEGEIETTDHSLIVRDVGASRIEVSDVNYEADDNKMSLRMLGGATINRLFIGRVEMDYGPPPQGAAAGEKAQRRKPSVEVRDVLLTDAVVNKLHYFGDADAEDGQGHTTRTVTNLGFDGVVLKSLWLARLKLDPEDVVDVDLPQLDEVRASGFSMTAAQSRKDLKIGDVLTERSVRMLVVGDSKSSIHAQRIGATFTFNGFSGTGADRRRVAFRGRADVGPSGIKNMPIEMVDLIKGTRTKIGLPSTTIQGDSAESNELGFVVKVKGTEVPQGVKVEGVPLWERVKEALFSVGLTHLAVPGEIEAQFSDDKKLMWVSVPKVELLGGGSDAKLAWKIPPGIKVNFHSLTLQDIRVSFETARSAPPAGSAKRLSSRVFTCSRCRVCIRR
jgi:hypothetical protein